MAITRERKEDLVEQYTDMLNQASGIIITEYRGLTMPQFDLIREKMREVNSQYTVTKNTLLKIALDNAGYDVPDELLAGPVAVGFAYDNLPGTVKALMDVTKDHELLMLKGAVASQTEYIDESQLKVLADLPSMDELRATLIGMITQPASQLISLLVAPQRNLVNVIAAYVDENTEDEEEAA